MQAIVVLVESVVSNVGYPIFCLGVQTIVIKHGFNKKDEDPPGYYIYFYTRVSVSRTHFVVGTVGLQRPALLVVRTLQSKKDDFRCIGLCNKYNVSIILINYNRLSYKQKITVTKKNNFTNLQWAKHKLKRSKIFTINSLFVLF